MPFCPNCNYEYVEGVTICPDCGEHLVGEEFFIKPEEWTEENWEVVYKSEQEYEVNMLRDNLESAGIKTAVLSQKDRNFPAPGDFSIIKLLVRKEDIQEALTFIHHISKESGEEEENNNGDEQ
jgi:hypothetical protein